MNIQNRPRVGQTIGTVVNEGGGLIARMTLWLQQYLISVGRNPDNSLANQVVGASPYTYTNTGDFDLTVVVSGGTVSDVSFSRDGINFVPVATTSFASVTLNPGDMVRVTYTVLPSLVLIPR